MKPEFPPLLQPGFIPMSLSEVDQRCVQAFPNSQTRVSIFKELNGLISNLTSIGVNGDLWLNGSFMTQKENPGDVDLVLCFDGIQFNQWSQAARDKVTEIINDPKMVPFCDAYVTFDFPDGHHLFNQSAGEQAYWRGWFGFTRSKPPQAKGIGFVTI